MLKERVRQYNPVIVPVGRGGFLVVSFFLSSFLYPPGSFLASDNLYRQGCVRRRSAGEVVKECAHGLGVKMSRPE
jgi:hypothetical protein